MMSWKRWKRTVKKVRNGWAARFFDTRYGRELLINSMSPRVLSMTVDCGDHIMSFSPNEYIGRKIFRKGHFDRDHVERLLAILQTEGQMREGSTLLELGGNIGTQTVYFGLTKAFSTIVTVEPDPRNFKLLQVNVEQNHLSDIVRTVNCAAGDGEGEIEFFIDLKNHGKSSAIRQSANQKQIAVPVKPVSQILKDVHVDPEEIGLIWMDIEGYEPVACRSMEMLLRRRVPLYMEFSPAFYGPQQTVTFVSELSGFYDRCIVFFESGSREMKVRDIPVDQEQFDILLLPDRKSST